MQTMILLNATDTPSGKIPTEAILMNPRLWQSLGKAMGWKYCTLGCAADNRSPNYCGASVPENHQQQWLYEWHRFVDTLADGKTAEEFFVSLN
jgi:hypothetical protein